MKHLLKDFVKLEYTRQWKLFYRELLECDLQKGDVSHLLPYWQEIKKSKLSKEHLDIDSASDRQKILAKLENLLGENVKDHQMISIGKMDEKDGERRSRQTVSQKNSHVVVLHNLRSSFNIGSIIRSAECFAFKKVYLTGYSATPENKKVQETAMQTDQHIEWEYVEDVYLLIEKLRYNYKIVALELSEAASEIDKYNFTEPCAIFLGNESLGIEEEICKKSDDILQIPIHGWKNSLNVGASFAICGYEICRQNNR